jgi:hypothetical protein
VNYEKLAIRRVLLEDDLKKIWEKRKQISANDINFKFYQISDCPTLNAFI